MWLHSGTLYFFQEELNCAGICAILSIMDTKDEGAFLSRIESELDRLSVSELHILHRRVGERLRIVHAAEELQALSRFSMGDRVSFVHGGEHFAGYILRINRRSVTVATNRGEWKVAPSFLTRTTR